MPTIAITAVTSQLGQGAAEALIARGTDPSSIVGIARDASRAADLAAQGVEIREADYTDQASYEAALQGVDRVLLISSGDIFADRSVQHRNVIEAAKAVGVSLIAYTSIVNADTATHGLAKAHQDTEAILAEAGVPYVLLRNGWYTENYLGAIEPTLQFGLAGSAGDGKVNVAPRADYAEAAAVVIGSDEDQAGKVYELGGDTALTLAEIAALIGEAAGQEVAYVDLPEEEYAKVLAGAGLPEPLTIVLASSSAGTGRGELHTASSDLSSLLGRPTVPAAETITAAVKAATGAAA